MTYDQLIALAREDPNVLGPETLARSHGLGRVIDGWEPDLVWLRG